LTATRCFSKKNVSRWVRVAARFSRAATPGQFDGR